MSHVSPAARELAMNIIWPNAFREYEHLFTQEKMRVDEAAKLIQSAVKELVEKAGAAEREIALLKSALAKRVATNLSTALAPLAGSRSRLRRAQGVRTWRKRL